VAFAYEFLPYEGKTTKLNPSNLKHFGLGASVVLYITERITTQRQKLFYDRYYSSSHQLLEMLKSRNILVAETVRINHFANPPFLTDKEIKKKIERAYKLTGQL
jgi:hypothetical protein